MGGPAARSIWAATPAQQQRQTPPAPITRDSFEALPNTTANQANHSPQYHAAAAAWSQMGQHGTPSPLGYGAAQVQHQPAQQYAQHAAYQHQQQAYQYAPQQQFSQQSSYPVQQQQQQQQPSTTSAAAASATSFFGGAFSPFSPQQAGQPLPPSAPASWTFQPNATVSSGASAAPGYAAYADNGAAQAGYPYAVPATGAHPGSAYPYKGFG